MRELSFTQKRDIVINAVAYLNNKFNQDFIVHYQFLSFEEYDNAWLLVLSDYDESKFYFSVFEWEIKGDFIKRVSQKKDPFLATIVEIPSSIVQATIYDKGAVVFKLQSLEYLVFNFAGEELMRNASYTKVQEHLCFLEESLTMHENLVC